MTNDNSNILESFKGSDESIESNKKPLRIAEDRTSFSFDKFISSFSSSANTSKKSASTLPFRKPITCVPTKPLNVFDELTARDIPL